MENTESISTSAAVQSMFDLLDNAKLNINSADTYSIGTTDGASIDTSGWPGNITWQAYQMPDTTNKLEEIKEYLKDNLEAVNDKINSVLDLIKENGDFIDTYNNMLQYLIGQKQTLINIQKLF